MKTTILCTLLFSIGLKGICQSDNALKYLSALVYLKANHSINESIAKTYPMWFKKNHTCIDFKISKTVRFISLKEFKDSKEIKEYVVDSVLIDGIKPRGKYFFYPYTSNFLQRVEEAEPSNAKIYLTFSNPINNYVVAEIQAMDPEGVFEFGKVMYILFFFDSLGTVQKTICSRDSFR